MDPATPERALLSWRLALGLSAAAWVVATMLSGVVMAAADAPLAALPPFLPPIVLALSALIAVGAARLLLKRSLSFAAFTDAQDPGPALGAALALLAGLFLGAAIGLALALAAGMIAAQAAPPPLSAILLAVVLWLPPAATLKLIDYLALRRERQI